MFKSLLKLIIKPHKVIKHKQLLKETMILLDISNIDFIRYFLKLATNIRFFIYIDNIQKDAKRACSEPNKLGGNFDFVSSVITYIIVRHVKPQIVVETGVGPGGSSAFILQALRDNKKGFLYSIDLPGNDMIVYPKIGKNFNIHIPEGWKPGWLIPPWLKNRHQLIIGDSKKELPNLMKKISFVDIFLHDSLHTDEHILMEFNTVFPYINRKGVLLCDDVNEDWSLAFIKFCETKQIPYVVFKNRLGIAKCKL